MAMEKNIETMMQMSALTYDKFWDILFASLSNFSWTHEQVEKLAQTYIDQRKVNRQEAAKITEELMKQARHNQQKIRELVEESIKSGNTHNPFAEVFNYNDLTKKLTDLERQVEELKNTKE